MTSPWVELAALKTAGAERLSGGQAVLEFGVEGPPGSEPLPITSSRMIHLWDGLHAAYRIIGIPIGHPHTENVSQVHSGAVDLGQRVAEFFG